MVNLENWVTFIIAWILVSGSLLAGAADTSEPMIYQSLAGRWQIVAKDQVPREAIVPGVWPYEGIKRATYSKVFRIRADLLEQPLAVFLGSVVSVTEVRLNGEVVGKLGSLSPNYEEPPENYPQVYSLPRNLIHRMQDNLLSVEVEVLSKGDGGIERGPVLIGNQYYLEKLAYKHKAQIRIFDHFMLTFVLFGVGLLAFLLLQAGIKTDYLYLLVLSFLICMSFSGSSQWFYDLGFSGPMMKRITWFSFNLILPITLCFIASFLHAPKTAFFYSIVVFGSTITVGLLLVADFDTLTVPYFILLVLSGCLIIKMLRDAWVQQRGEALALSTGLALLVLCSVLAMLEVFGIYEISWIPLADRSTYLFEWGLLALYATFLYSIVARLLQGRRQMRFLLNQSVVSKDQERLRIAKELHDDIGQNMLVLRLKIQNLANQSNQRIELGQIADDIRSLIDDVRSTAYELHPPYLEHFSFLEMLHVYTDQNLDSFPKIEYGRVEDTRPLNKEMLLNLFRIFQEFLQNTIKHASANSICIDFYQEKDVLTMKLSDDGVGTQLQAQSFTMGAGLQNIRDRAMSVDGVALFRSAPGEGMHLTVSLPLKWMRESIKGDDSKLQKPV